MLSLPLRGQGALEYLLLIGGGVLVTVVVLLVVLATPDIGGNVLSNQLSGYQSNTSSFFSGGSGANCGDTICGVGENRNNCPSDCFCGNDLVEVGFEECEITSGGTTLFSTPYSTGFCGDYPTPATSGFDSGNLACNPNTCRVDLTNCQSSSGNPCGDNTCDASESTLSCPADCFCGNATCDSGETSLTCVSDCPLAGNAPTISFSGLPGGNKRVLMSWSIVSDYEAGSFTYQIKGGTPGSMSSVLDAASFASFVGTYDSGPLTVAQTGTAPRQAQSSSLANGSTYEFRMLACNSIGCTVSTPASVSLPTRCTSGNCKYWFHPNNGKTKNVTGDPLFYTYSHDGYLTEANWSSTVNTIDVFGYFINMLQNAQQSWYDSHLKLLNEKGVRVNVEVGGIRKAAQPTDCDPNGTGTYASDKVNVFDKLAAAGSDDFIVSMDNVFSYNVIDGYYDKYNPSNSCQISASDVSQIMVNYINALQNDFPEAEIGWVEAIPLFAFGAFPSETPSSTPPDPDLQSLADTFFTTAQAQGAVLDFFHVDQTFTAFLVSGLTNTNPPDGPYQKMKAVQQYMRNKSVRFGILLNADSKNVSGDPTGNLPQNQQIFYDLTIGYYDCIVSHPSNIRLDDIMVESWYPYPYYTVLESTAYTSSNVMLGLIATATAPTHTCNYPLGQLPPYP